MEHFYPLLFEPNLHETVWGGDRLTTWKALPAHASPVGESWEVSAVPSSINIIANGDFKGMDLVSLINRYPTEILGEQPQPRSHLGWPSFAAIQGENATLGEAD